MMVGSENAYFIKTQRIRCLVGWWGSKALIAWFCYLALGIEVDCEVALCEIFDSGLVLVMMECFKQAYGLVGAVERNCRFQMRSRTLSIARLDRGGSIGIHGRNGGKGSSEVQVGGHGSHVYIKLPELAFRRSALYATSAVDLAWRSSCKVRVQIGLKCIA